MINYELLLVKEYNGRICVETDNGQNIPLASIHEFTYKFDTYSDFPFESGWCRFTLYANVDSFLDECLPSNTFYEHIYDRYKRSIRLRIYEKKSFFLNEKKWFKYFYNLARCQVDYLLDKQYFLFEFKLQQKEIKESIIKKYYEM